MISAEGTFAPELAAHPDGEKICPLAACSRVCRDETFENQEEQYGSIRLPLSERGSFD